MPRAVEPKLGTDFGSEEDVWLRGKFSEGFAGGSLFVNEGSSKGRPSRAPHSRSRAALDRWLESTPGYRQRIGHIRELSRQVRERLHEDQMADWLRFEDALLDHCSCSCHECFEAGIRFAARVQGRPGQGARRRQAEADLRLLLRALLRVLRP